MLRGHSRTIILPAKSDSTQSGFTIVELLIVIVVIGILAAITIVAYNGVTQNAKIASINADLENASKQIRLYQVTNGMYPTSVDCSASPAANSICLRSSQGNTFAGLSSINTTSPQSFCVSVTNGSLSYYTSQDQTPSVGTCSTMSGLIGWWKFDGDTSDSSGNNNTPVNNGATLTAGQNGQQNDAFNMNGGDINFGSPAIFSNLASSGFSYSLWTMRTGTSSGHWPIIMGGDTHVYYGIRSQNYGDNIGVEYGTSPFSGSSYSNIGGPSLSLNTWHLDTITYSGTTLSLYIDGALRSTATITLNPSNQGLDSQSWNGNIDDMRIYNRALSSGEVAALYQMGAQ